MLHLHHRVTTLRISDFAKLASFSGCKVKQIFLIKNHLSYPAAQPHPIKRRMGIYGLPLHFFCITVDTVIFFRKFARIISNFRFISCFL